jgi:hypothetical protein
MQHAVHITQVPAKLGNASGPSVAIKSRGIPPAFFMNAVVFGPHICYREVTLFQTHGAAMKLSTLIACILLIAVTGCKDSTPPKAGEPAKAASTAPGTPSESTHNLIVKYNSLLSEGYKTTNMTKLQEVTTPELAEKAYYHMAAIGEGNSRMVSDLKKIDFVETDCAVPTKCRVVTKERWDFAYADIITGARSNEVKDYQYDVQYLLENRQGRWLITEITATGEERKELPAWNKMFKKQ